MTDHKRDVRNLLIDPRALCEKLGLLKGSKRNGKGLLIRCPAHEERDASCTVSLGNDGTIYAKCHACGWTADALGLVALTHSLSLSTDFPEVLAIGAELGGDQQLADEIRSGRPNPGVRRRVIPEPPKQPEAPYPDPAEMQRFWESLPPLSGVNIAPISGYLHGRAIDAGIVADRDLARCILLGDNLPMWANFVDSFGDVRGNWYTAGFRIVLPVYDSEGALRSVRGWQCCGREGPRRLPPRGYRHTGLVLANKRARKLLLDAAEFGKRHGSGSNNPVEAPSDSDQLTPSCREASMRGIQVILVEGESDFLTVATRHDRDAVFGIINGGWTKEHADKIPDGSTVLVMTDVDKTGDRYAREIIETVGKRCEIWRQVQ